MDDQFGTHRPTDGAHERTAEDGVDDADTFCASGSHRCGPHLGSPVVIFVFSAGRVLTKGIAARQAGNCANQAITLDSVQATPRASRSLQQLSTGTS
jgi:hypothetical protein